jgi:pimeloyl-ACP methyl ester carboxylesterase
MSRTFPLILVFALFLGLSVSLPSASGQTGEAVTPSGRLSIPSRKVLVSGILVHYVEAGKGPTLLFLHGLGGSWKDWAANIPAFAASYRVCAVDFPGFGESDKPEVEYSIDWLTDLVQRFLQERNLEEVSVVGHSMGALVALNLAARPRSPIRKLAVCDAVGIGDKADFLSYAMTRKVMGPETRWESFEEALRDEFKRMLESFIKDQKPKTARDFFESVPRNPFTGNPFLPMTPSVQMTASILDFDIRPKLASIRQPTLILWGAKDPVAPPQDASFLHREIRQSILILYPDCGHSPMIEKPDLFNRELEKFLQAGEPASSR